MADVQISQLLPMNAEQIDESSVFEVEVPDLAAPQSRKVTLDQLRLAAGGFLSLKRFGAKMDGSDATTAWLAAMAELQAIATGGGQPPTLLIPPGACSIAQGVAAFDYLTIVGDGKPTITFVETSNELLAVTGHRYVRLHGLHLVGTNAANVVAIRHKASVTSSLNCRYLDVDIDGFGKSDGTSGGGYSIESDSAGLEIGQSFLANACCDISLSAPTDGIDIHHCFGTAQGGTLPGRFLDVSGAAGAGAMGVTSCILTKEGMGQIRINASGGLWSFRSVEGESTTAIVNASNAMVEILGAQSVLVTGGSWNGHSQTGAHYGIYFADAVDTSGEQYITYSGLTSKSVRTSASARANLYGPSWCDRGPTAMYDADRPGIIQSTGTGGAGFFQGFANPGASGFGRNGACADGPINFTNAETGANNAIATTWPVTLIAGLRLQIPLNHSLQAGPNTLNYNAGGAVAIKSHRNPANDIGTAYAAGGTVDLYYDGTRWLDMSQ